MDHIPTYKELEEEYFQTETELAETEKTLRTLRGINVTRYGHFSNIQREFDVSSDKDQRQLGYTKKPKVDNFYKLEDISDESDDSPKKVIPSTVVVKNFKNSTSKKEAIRNQNVDPKVELRNRRILGMLQGTLLKFKTEAKKREPQELKRVQVEEKVEAAAKVEKEEELKQREKLFHNRKDKQLQLRCLKEMMARIESHEIWKNNQKHLCNFMVTQSEPAICFKPSSHTSRTKNVHDKCKEATLKSIDRHEMQLIDDLHKIKERYNVSESSKTEAANFLMGVAELPVSSKHHSLHEEKECSDQRFSIHADDDDMLCLD